MRRLAPLLLLPWLHAPPAPAQLVGSGLDDLDAYVREAVRVWEVPGLAIAVVRDDSVLFARGYGVRRLGSPEPVDEHTLFANASTTKAFTVFGLATLVGEGRIDWDDRVIEHVHGFAVADPYVTREIRVRDLLTHQLGFADPDYLWYGLDTDLGAILHRLRHHEPATSFRSRFAYNNVGYAIAGSILGSVDGSGWDEAIRRRLLDPLGMSDTFTRGADVPEGANVAMPHDLVADTLAVIGRYLNLVDPIPAAGSMFSSVSDMARWMMLLLAECEWEGEPLLSAEACEELLKPQVTVPAEEFYPTMELTDPWFTGYGFGWFLQDYRGRRLAFHTGSIDGYVAIVGLLPEMRAGIVVFANRDHAELRHALMLRVFDTLIGPPVRDWSAELKKLYEARAAEQERRRAEVRSRRAEGTRPSAPLEAYVGRYANDLFGEVDVRLEGLVNDGASIRLVLVRSNFLTADMEHWHHDTFQLHWRPEWLRPALVTFRIGPEGRVDALHVSGQELWRAPELPDAPPAGRR